MVILLWAAARPDISSSANSVPASLPKIVLMVSSMRRFQRTIEQYAPLEKAASAPTSPSSSLRWIASLTLAMTDKTLTAALGSRPPDQKASFHHGYSDVDQDDENRQHEHPRKNAGDVEHAFGLLDQIA